MQQRRSERSDGSAVNWSGYRNSINGRSSAAPVAGPSGTGQADVVEVAMKQVTDVDAWEEETDADQAAA